MNFKKIFTRNKIYCDTVELNKFVIWWVESGGWKLKDFVKMLEFAGIEKPVKFKNFDARESEFECINAKKEEFSIKLLFGNSFGILPEIHVSEREETRIYKVNGRKEVVLTRKNIKKRGKELKNFYNEIYVERELTIDKSHKLLIQIEEPQDGRFKDEISVLRNCDEFEKYLLGLDNSLEVSEVYEKVIELLDFTDEDVLNSGKILIVYEKISVEEDKIYLVNGKNNNIKDF